MSSTVTIVQVKGIDFYHACVREEGMIPAAVQCLEMSGLSHYKDPCEILSSNNDLCLAQYTYQVEFCNFPSRRASMH